MDALASPDFLWFAEGLLAALCGGLAMALLVGMLLLAAPRALLEINRRVSRWIDTRGALEVLERPLMLERLFYRHHRWLGGAIALGAGYVLWRWAVAFDRASVIGLLDRSWVTGGLDWVVAAGEFLVVGLHVLILAIGLVILARPSMLKDLERAANRSYGEFSSQSLDTVIESVDRGVAIHPRLSGLALLVASIWSLVALLPVFLQTIGR
jgi:hypothetical protein